MPSSAAELAYIHSSLLLSPPVRLDARSPTQFRPLIAETGLLPSTNGSARICFPDGGECIVGVRASVEPFSTKNHVSNPDSGESKRTALGKVDVSIQGPGVSTDEGMGSALVSVVKEGLVGKENFLLPTSSRSGLLERLGINERWAWKLSIDILLLISPSSYPLPLISMTTHLALLCTKLPALTSESNDDPLFNDDWDAATWLFPPSQPQSQSQTQTHVHPTSLSQAQVNVDRPAISILIATISPRPRGEETILFDPSAEELLVADTIFAVTLTLSPGRPSSSQPSQPSQNSTASTATSTSAASSVKVLSIRTISPPSHSSAPAVLAQPDPAPAPSAITPRGTPSKPSANASGKAEAQKEGLWTPRKGGFKPALLERITRLVTGPEGPGVEVFTALEDVRRRDELGG